MKLWHKALLGTAASALIATGAMAQGVQWNDEVVSRFGGQGDFRISQSYHQFDRHNFAQIPSNHDVSPSAKNPGNLLPSHPGPFPHGGEGVIDLNR